MKKIEYYKQVKAKYEAWNSITKFIAGLFVLIVTILGSIQVIYTFFNWFN